MCRLAVAGQCTVAIDDAGVLEADRPLMVAQSADVIWAAACAADGRVYRYRLDVAPGHVTHVELTGGARLRLLGVSWLSASVAVVCDNSTLEFALPAPVTLCRLSVLATGTGRVTSCTRAFVRRLDAQLDGRACIDGLYVADDACVVSQNRLAGAHLHVHRGTRCAGNGVHVQDMAAHVSSFVR